MKKTDFIVIACIIIGILPFFISDTVYGFYLTFNANHPMIMSFLKFAILSTFGECIGLRITSGVYNKKGFGVLPRAIVWGFLGMAISMAMTIFSTGVPVFLEKTGLSNASEIIKGDFSTLKIFIAFCISVAMNSIFAPVFMTFHKVTDTHIMNNGGTLKGLFKPIQMKKILVNLDWGRQWGFVFKKTIPFFWYPAHTITFLLPAAFQVLFAAILGVALGILLSIAAIGNSKR
jgi:hypothetical protein